MTLTDDAPPYDPWHDEPEPAPRPTRNTQTPPHDTDAEEAVLGAMLISVAACDAAMETGLHADHFYTPHHAQIYAACVKVITAGDIPDAITVAAHLGGTPDATHRLIALCTGHTWTSTNASAYARRVIHCARARTIAADAIAVSQTAMTGDLDNALDQLHRLTTNLPTDDTDTSWAPLDLASTFDGAGPPQPTILARNDGLCLLYGGKVHAFNAESESGKSWLALAATVERLNAGEHVLYLDFEDDAQAIVGRLTALGLDRATIETQFHYSRPADPIDAVATATLERILIDHRPTLAIIDGVTEVCSQNGWSVNDNDDVARFMLALPRRIARHGAAVVLIDHVTKDREGRGRFALGAQHKLSGLDGAAYHLEVTRPFGIGRDGAARITVTKDRPGHVRGASIDGHFAAEMRVQSLPDGAVHISLAERSDPTAAPKMRPTNLMEQVSKAVQEMNDAGIEPTKNGVVGDVPSAKANVLKAVDRLVAEKYLAVVTGPKNAQHLRSLRPYRQALDPGSDSYIGTGEHTPDDDL